MVRVRGPLCGVKVRVCLGVGVFIVVGVVREKMGGLPRWEVRQTGKRVGAVGETELRGEEGSSAELHSHLGTVQDLQGNC